MTRRTGAVVLLVLAAACSSSTTAPTTTASASRTSTSTVAATTTSSLAPSTTGATAGTTTTTAAPPTTTLPTTSAPSAPTSSVATVAPATTTTVTPTMLLGLATDPTGLARQLTDALRTIHDPGAAPDAVAAAGRLQQLVLRRLASRPEWQAPALAAVGDDVRSFAANDVAAANAPDDASLAKPVPPLAQLPAWTIRTPLPPDELLGYYKEAEAATGIGWFYLAAINFVETRMGRVAGLSSAGAIGPMQFLPSTWAACCTGDPTVDRDAILGAATYLQRRGAPADMARAILGYNPNNAYLTMVQRYAENMAADERTYLGYHAWQVFVPTVAGPVRLPEGYRRDTPIPAAEYVAAHPEDRA